MDIEIRSDNEAIVSGYVNAVERFSRPIRHMGRTFVEKVKAGAFGREIERAKTENRAIVMLIDHERKAASTAEGTLELREDSIGLYARAEIRAPDIIAEIKSKPPKGWSFGFRVKKDSFIPVGNREERTLEDIVLEEVSLIVNKSPAYIATSVEVRDGEEESREIRGCEEEARVYLPRNKRQFDQSAYDGYKGRIELLKLM